MYCDKKREPPSPTPPPLDGDGLVSFSFEFDGPASDDDFWDTWVPAPAPTGDTLPPVSDPDMSFEFEQDEEPERPVDEDKPKSDADCFDRLTDNMKVSERFHFFFQLKM